MESWPCRGIVQGTGSPCGARSAVFESRLSTRQPGRLKSSSTKLRMTDAPPRKTSSARFLQSDRMRTLDLPQDRTLLAIAKSIESGMKAGSSADVRRSCAEFLDFAAAFYEVPSCGFRVLAARPLRVRENWASELFGDYHPETMLIRIWMRTAVRKEITSFGTFLSTLCHEFCRHLDFQRFRFPDSWHARGFYERAATLYHYARETPQKRLCWGPTAC